MESPLLGSLAAAQKWRSPYGPEHHARTSPYLRRNGRLPVHHATIDVAPEVLAALGGWSGVRLVVVELRSNQAGLQTHVRRAHAGRQSDRRDALRSPTCELQTLPP